MKHLDVIVSFSAGLLSFVSPCVLPLIPAYLGYIAGSAASEIKSKSKTNLLIRSLFFVLGFSIVFIMLGVTVSAVSKIFAANLIWFRRIGGIFVFVLGLHMTGFIKIKCLYSEKRLLSSGIIGKKLGPFVMGVAFAAGWTPCVGPILSSILIYAGSMETLGKGVLLLVFYSLGLGVPFLLTALLIDRFSGFFSRFTRYLPFVSVISGFLIMLMGILIFTDQMTLIGRYFSSLGV